MAKKNSKAAKIAAAKKKLQKFKQNKQSKEEDTANGDDREKSEPSVNENKLKKRTEERNKDTAEYQEEPKAASKAEENGSNNHTAEDQLTSNGDASLHSFKEHEEASTSSKINEKSGTKEEEAVANASADVEPVTHQQQQGETIESAVAADNVPRNNRVREEESCSSLSLTKSDHLLVDENDQAAQLDGERCAMNHETDNNHLSEPLCSSPSATTESLMQMSSKLNSIAAEASFVSSNEDLTHSEHQHRTSQESLHAQLEERNKELVEAMSGLRDEKSVMQKLIDNLENELRQVHERNDKEKRELYGNVQKDHTTYQQQIQVQMHTIGVLVAEKQELQHQLHERRATAEQQSKLREQCQDELKSCRMKMQTVERDNKSKTGEIAALSKLGETLRDEKNELQKRMKNLNQVLEENRLHSGELSHKLHIKENECEQLNHELGDKNEKLAMAEVLLQQLSSNGGAVNGDEMTSRSEGGKACDEVEQLREERENLNRKLVEYQQSFEQLTSEREQLSKQYEDVNQQMKNQISQLISQVEILESEKSELVEAQNELNARISSFDGDRGNAAPSSGGETEGEQGNAKVAAEYEERLKELARSLERVEGEKKEMEKRADREAKKNEQLARMLEEREREVDELTGASSVSTEEHHKLVEQAHNDRTALSRALIQNKQLKNQLEELQLAFVNLSNDKLELANQIDSLRHSEKRLKEIITAAEEEAIRKAAETSAQSVDQAVGDDADADVKEEEEEETKYDDNEEEVTRLREMQSAHAETVARLRHQVESGELDLMNMNEENKQLKLMIAHMARQQQESLMQAHAEAKDAATAVQQAGDVSNEEEEKAGASLQEEADASLQTAEGEPADATSKTDDDAQLQELVLENEELRRRLGDLEAAAAADEKTAAPGEDDDTEGEEPTADAIRDDVDVVEDFAKMKADFDSLKHDMSLLQDRFSSVQRERGEALTRIDDLEHINLQLQNECDTIGEYITLYHNQRKALQKRHHEKDEYINLMAQERAAMQERLEEAERAMGQFVSNQPPSYGSVHEHAEDYPNVPPHERETDADQGEKEEGSTTSEQQQQQPQTPTPTTPVRRPPMIRQHRVRPLSSFGVRYNSPYQLNV